MSPWRTRLQSTLGLLALGATLGSTAPAAAAPAVDTDLDGVGDAGDAFPCDWRRAAVTFVPGEFDYSTLLFEDNWPARGDLDFNDGVLLHHVAVFRDGSGRASGLRVTLLPRAIGAQISSGVALRLPLPASAIGSIQRTVGSDAPIGLTVLADEAELVIPIVTRLRDLFGAAPGLFINTQGGAPSIGDGNLVTVDVEFHTPVELSVAADPFDFYFFRTDDPRHQIHRPQFSGTDTMNDALFGTADDGSTGERYFVDQGGLPFVLSVPAQSLWPLEQVRVERLWPELTRFAESGGSEAQDFYATNVGRSAAFPAPATAQAPAIDFGLCVAPSCTDGARNGLETDVDCGAGCAPCGLGANCRVHDDCARGVCVAAACVDADERSCTLDHGTGTQLRAGSGWAACRATQCDPGYRLSNGACVLLTYAWSSGGWGTCGGGTASPTYGAWGTCSGGSGAWSYGAWGTCSAAAVCSGSGTQTRSASCVLSPASGTQSRTAACAWDGASGTQSRAVTCQDNFGQTVSEALCAGPAPAATQSCTPAGTPSTCGAVVTTQACTPTDLALCGAAVTSQACASPAGTQSCTLANGTGSQSCAAGATTYGACTPVSCNSGFHIEGGACLANTRACTVANGAGTQTWSGAAWGSCQIASCNANFASCDNNAANGCEADLLSSATSCGACGNVCGGGTTCYAGRCSATCASRQTYPAPIAGCTNLSPLAAAYSVSSAYGGTTAVSVGDANSCTGWNSGTYGGTWQVDFGSARTIAALTMRPAMLPNGNVVHVVETSNNGSTWTNALTISQFMADSNNYAFTLATRVSARYLRVRTTSTPSWLSWYDINVWGDCP